MDTSIPAVRIATGTEPPADVKTPEWVSQLPTEPMTHRAWCGLCGTYVYDKERLPCAVGESADWANCGLNGQTTEQVTVSTRDDHLKERARIVNMLSHQKQHHQGNVIPLSADGVQELLQRDHGDETAYEAQVEAINERLDDECSEPATTTPTTVKRALVEEAMRITDGARRKAYGSPEDNFGRIAELWEPYLNLIHPHFSSENHYIRLKPKDIATLMILMKIARIIETPDHRDSYTDILGYTLCGAEIAGVK